MYLTNDYSNALYWVLTFFIFFSVITGRYLVIAGLFYAIFYTWYPGKWVKRKLSHRPYRPGQLRKEICWSTLSALIFALSGTWILWLWQSGSTKIYSDILQYGIWYLPCSLLISLFIQETYYYWTHRLMHHPMLFSTVHKIHHASNSTSPFTAFSFHPFEALIQALAMPLILMTIPMHAGVLLIQLLLMSFTSVINHLEIEIYPLSFTKNVIGRWLIGATHHSLHHKKYQYNFGLYFTFWDKLGNTESPHPSIHTDELKNEFVKKKKITDIDRTPQISKTEGKKSN